MVEELERNLKIFDGALRYMTSRVEVETKVAPPVEGAPPLAEAAPADAEGSEEPAEEAPTA